MLSRKGSFTKAAKELHLTQSAVSHAMKALEEDVGCRLLDRVGKKVLLTQAGEQFFQRVDKIFGEMILARAELDQLGEWGRGRLRVGASAAACQYILPSVLREFKKEFPKCRLSIEPGDTKEIVESLRANAIDVAVTLEPERESDFAFSPLFTDELMFLVNPSIPGLRLGGPCGWKFHVSSISCIFETAVPLNRLRTISEPKKWSSNPSSIWAVCPPSRSWLSSVWA